MVDRTSVISRNAVLDEIYQAVTRANELLAADQRLALDETTRLFGDGGPLDSLGLVSLILDVEDQLADRTGVHVVLADERAMARFRTPFRDVGRFADYIVARLSADDAAPADQAATDSNRP